MPKSKRSKVVTLTKTGKKTQERKSTLFQQIRDTSDAFANIHVFSVANMRNNFLKEIREELKESCRFFFGKNRVMAKSLGLTIDQEYKKDFASLAKQLEGDVGLLFTNSDNETIKAYYFYLYYLLPDTLRNSRSKTTRAQDSLLPGLSRSLQEL
jgi:mRNA turnover protein 4